MTKEQYDAIEEIEKIFDCVCTTRTIGINQTEATIHIFQCVHGKVRLHKDDLKVSSFLTTYTEQCINKGIKIGRGHLADDIRTLLNI